MKITDAIASLCILSACSHTIEVRPGIASGIDALNRQAEDRTARVTLSDGSEIVVEAVSVDADGISWYDPALGGGSAATVEVRRISFRDRKRGAVEGLAIGGLTMLPVGLLSAAIGDEGTSAGSAALQGGLAGVVWGAAVGAFVGSRTHYDFAHPRTGRWVPVEQRQRFVILGIGASRKALISVVSRF